MVRTPTTTDAFNAVAEVNRRDLLDAIGAGEATVGQLVDRVGLSQPQVSKHLGVLRAVGLVLARMDGRRRWYRVNGAALKPILAGCGRSSAPGTSVSTGSTTCSPSSNHRRNHHERHQPPRLRHGHASVRP